MIKSTITALLLVIPLTPLAIADIDVDIRDKVQQGAKVTTNRIDIGNHIYGYPMGITEDDFIKEEGKPTGYLSLGNKQTALLYGRSHAYIFTDKKLTGLRVTSSVFDWKLANKLRIVEKHTNENWELSNGIKADMTEEDANKILGNDLIKNDFQPHFILNGYRIEINYASYTENGKTVKKSTVSISLK